RMERVDQGALDVYAAERGAQTPVGTYARQVVGPCLEGGSLNSLQGVVEAMSHSPQAARQWLAPVDSGGSVDSTDTADRIGQLMGYDDIGDNQWTDDWLRIADAVSATSPAVNGGEDGINGKDTAAVVSGVLNGVGESGEALVLSGMGRALVGQTLARYPLGVTCSVEGDQAGFTMLPNPEASWSADLPEQPVMSHLALSNLLGQVGQDDGVTVDLQASLTAFNNERVAVVVEDIKNGSQGYESFAEILQEQGRTDGFFRGAVARTGEQVGADADERVQAYVDTAAALAGLIPVAPGAGGLIDAAASFTKSRVVDAASSSASSALAGQEAEARSRNQQHYVERETFSEVVTTLTLLRSGLYTDDEMVQIVRGASSGVSSVLDPSGNVLIEAVSDAQEEDLSVLSDEQYQALADIGGVLPSDGRPGLSDITDRVAGEYREGHDDACPGSGNPPAPRGR
uniref:DUF6571 family protein n=1 Tax=Actinomyces wuliandei TaxID=2057743 RepID=UPI0015D64C37